MFDIEEELKKLPGKPGVYIMHDERDDIIYVGKAVVLKNRVRQYFQNSRNLSAKIASMVPRIARFEYIVTDSEMEALVLECNLIKEHRPKYNTMLKDDKTYPFIKVTADEAFPRILMVRRLKKDGARYFGPYTSAQSVRDVIELLRKIYKVRSCSRNLPKDAGKERPCLYHHMGQCDAPCQGMVSAAGYQERIAGVLKFLGGDYKEVTRFLTDKMMAASDAMEFERAIEYRELLESVKQVAQKQKITDAHMDDRDVIAYARHEDEAVVQVFFIRGGKLLGREHHFLTGVSDEGGSALLGAFVKQFYAGAPYIPAKLLLQEPIEDQDIIETWLGERRGAKVTLAVPKRGEKERLVELAARNAAMVLEKDREKERLEEARTVGAVRELCALMDLPPAYRMEAYDISNISGFENVGSMVVYEQGKPKKNAYRKFKIKWFAGQDDYQSMEEVLTRRLTHGLQEMQALTDAGKDPMLGSFSHLPDLILMDGGKGQVNVALKVLEQLHLSIPVCGMVKDDHHNTRGLYYMNREIPISRFSECFKLITRIQDEAHRFAIEYHRSLRGKDQVRSVLDDIPGIGPARRKSLMRHFKTVEAVRDAGVEALAAIDGMNRPAAERVFDFFHPAPEEERSESETDGSRIEETEDPCYDDIRE